MNFEPQPSVSWNVSSCLSGSFDFCHKNGMSQVTTRMRHGLVTMRIEFIVVLGGLLHSIIVTVTD
jgi:hypothetical protein